jgi:S-formylglutathione hydrolase FrmB
MKSIQRVYLLIALSFAVLSASAQQGKVLQSLTIESKILGNPIKYSVYLPAGYDASTKDYPVLYLLHGYTDNETTWIHGGKAPEAADNAIAKGEVLPMIIVMPDAGLTWYLNDYLGKVRYEDAFFKEFIPAIEKAYRIKADKGHRAIGGLSMGGYGSLLYAMKHADMFSGCIPMSAGVFTQDEFTQRLKNKDFRFAEIYGPMNGEALPETWKSQSILDLAKTLPKEQLASMAYYIDCGDDDFLIAGNCELHLILKSHDIPHQFRVRDGNHDWGYWQVSIVDGLRFLNTVFPKKQ